MGTLVQAPDRESVQISGLQAIVQPEETGGLGSFLSRILPAANQELDKYDEASRDRLIALGRNDQLNGVMHDVSILDRKNYRTGRNYQNVLNGQIALTQKFQEDINSTDDASFDPEELLRKGKEFIDQSVAIIHDSDLPDEMKKGLYDAQLKENATHMTMVEKKVKQITEDNAATARVNATAALAKDFTTKELTPEELLVSVEAFVEKRTLSTRLAYPDKSMEDIQAEVSADISAALTNALEPLRTNGSAEDVQRLQYLQEVAAGAVGLDLAASTKLYTKANTYIADIESNQTATKLYDVNNLINSWKTNPASRNAEATTAFLAEISADTILPYADKLTLMTKVLNESANLDKQILEAEVVPNPKEHTPASYKAMGKTEGEWVKHLAATFLNENPQQPETAGLEMMNFVYQMPEYSAAALKEGSELFFSGMIGYASMSDSDVKNDKYSELRREQFGVAQTMYKQYKAENSTKALDMLSGVDDRYIDVFTAAFETGRSLEDVRRMFKDNVSTEQKFDSMRNAVKDTGGITKALGLGSELVGGVDGRLNNSISDGVEPFLVQEVVGKLVAGQSEFVMTAQTSTPTSLVARYKKAGGFLNSPKGYSAAIMDIGVAKQVAGYRVAGTSVPLGTEYFGAAIDAEKERYAKQYGTSASNVLAVSDATGQQMYFKVYESKGLRGKGEANLKASGSTSMAKLKAGAEILRKRDSERVNSPAGESEKYSNVTIGKAVISDLSTRQRYNYSINGHYAKATGGNLALATEWVNHMQTMENFTSKGTTAKDANTGRVSRIYGHGMTGATLDANTPAGIRNAVYAARGNPQAMFDAQGIFVANYYKNINQDLANVRVPAPTAGAYPEQFKPSLMLIYDGLWHAGNTKKLAQAMNAPTYQQGRAILTRLSTYNRAKRGSPRNKFMENALYSHFKALGKL